MAERLTKKISKTIQNKYSLGSYLYYDFAEIDDTNKLLNKLGKLEDIMEKYGLEINDIDEILTNYIKEKELAKNNDKELRDTIQKLHTIIEAIGYDRDTWKRACELACKHIAEVEWFSCPETDSINEIEDEIKTLTQQSLNYFYQQAKKEGDLI